MNTPNRPMGRLLQTSAYPDPITLELLNQAKSAFSKKIPRRVGRPPFPALAANIGLRVSIGPCVVPITSSRARGLPRADCIICDRDNPRG